MQGLAQSWRRHRSGSYHADWGYFQKYNGIRDHRGGGRSSGRETAARVAGGVIARKILERRGVKIMAACVELGGTAVQDWAALDLENARNRSYCAATEAMMQHYVLLQRNLIYTGVTRGKQLVILVGESRALKMAVNNNKTRKRYTRLAQRLAPVE